MIKTGDEIIERASPEAIELMSALRSGKIDEDQITAEQRRSIQNYQDKVSRANMYYDDAQTRFRTMYERAAKYKSELKNDAEKKHYQDTDKSLEAVRKIWTLGGEAEEKARAERDHYSMAKISREIVNDSVNTLSGIKAPQLYMPVSEFALKQAPKTIGNVAYQAYDKFKESTPIIAVENIVPNMLFSRADSLIQLVKESRKQFVKNAVKDGMREEKAEKEAKKLIGATWDIAHINLLRRSGFSEKEVIEETKKIAPYIKKVHIADNFGLEHSDLPPGMGTAPIKEMLGAIKQSGFDGKSIVECGSFVGAFKTSAVPYMFEALGSPIYTPQGGAPFWGQARGLYGESPVSYGTTFPEQHFSMYGSGFSSLPSSLGGQGPGKQSRFSGAPME
jgi:hypothetical protein